MSEARPHAIVVNGACGRMGTLVLAALQREGFADIAGCDVSASLDSGSAKGEKTQPLGGSWSLVDDLVEGIEAGGVIVDFSHHSATPELLRAVELKKTPLVIGTTAQTAQEMEQITLASQSVPIVLAHNFSLGINRLAQVLPKLHVLLDDGFDVECVEAHHRYKRDAPSGTAHLLVKALTGNDPSFVHGRHGSDVMRQPGEVGTHALRLGGIPGEHTLYFANDDEVIEIRHRALHRGAFVSGVAPAVRFVNETPPGLYSMLDVMEDAP